MKNVYFILGNQGYGESLYLPYASACLAAYAWSLDDVRSAFRCADFFFQREAVPYVLSRLQEPVVVAFSCYTWTLEYNKRLARAIKEQFPDCLIVFGGHEVSEQDDLAHMYPDADFFIFGDGEVPFGALLQAIDSGRDYAQIPNIAYRSENRIVVNKREYDFALDFPSPYLTGFMDGFVEKYPEIDFSAIVETNRGCPYACAYCDWSQTQSIRTFPLQKVYAEIEWCCRHKIEYVFCADGNFGILDRDCDIAEFVVRAKKETGYPHVFSTCYAKNSNENVFRISKLFFENGISKAITLSYQTVSKTVLRNINRQNFSMEAFSEIVKRYNEHAIPTYTELILGLPGETKQSFIDGICSLVEAGQHNAITVSCCHVFRNALLNQKAYREKFGIQSKKVPMNTLYMTLPGPDDIIEYTDLVIATKDMSFEDMIDTFLFCVCLQGFHHVGLLKFFALYVHNELHVSYRSFYTALSEYIDQADETFLNRLFSGFRAKCHDLSLGEWTYRNPNFGQIGWYYEEGLFMEVVSEYERFWREILPFLRRYPIPEDVFEQLAAYQKFSVRLPGQTDVSADFDFDFYTYFIDALRMTPTPLQKRKNRVEVAVRDNVDSWDDYVLRIIMYGKKKGATLLTGGYYPVNVTYADMLT